MKASEDHRGSLPSGSRIPELDGIRAVAILLVISCHYEGFNILLGGMPNFGWIGVDIFFVLSGFLITSILIELRGSETPIKVFYLRRVLRIFPVYYLTIVVVSVISLACREHMIHPGWYLLRFLFFQSLKDSPELFKQVFARLVGAAPKLTLFPQAPLPKVAPGVQLEPWANTLSAAWSLSIEEYFYIIWAPIVIFLKSPRKVAVAAFAIFTASIAIQFLGFAGQDNYFEFFCRVDTIMAGCMLALFFRLRTRLQAHHKRFAEIGVRAAAIFLTIVLVVILFLNRPMMGRELRDSPSFMILGLPVLSALLSIALGWVVLHRGQPNILLRALRLRPARYLGTISYSLYLFHVPVYCCILSLVSAFHLSGFLISLTVASISLAISITLSALSWRYLEKPILDLKDRWAATPARVVVGAGVI
jgi:peptidoglycan/LPS O-acetylase OafA/YrhL